MRLFGSFVVEEETQEAENSGRVAVTAAHLKFQKVTSHPWHIRSICIRKAVDSRIGGQEDSGRTCHVAVVPFAKGHNFKIFPCFLCALALEIFELTLLEN